MMYVLIMVCHLDSFQCKTPETAMYFVYKDACQKMADDFNKDEENKKAGAEERCLLTFQGPG